MADNNVNVIQDQDFYGAVRFFGTVELKLSTVSLSFASLTLSGALSVGDFITIADTKGIYFGATNRRMYYDGGLFIEVLGLEQMRFRGADILVSKQLRDLNGTSATVQYHENPSATNPVFCPAFADEDTGVGHASANNLSLIAGGAEIARINSAGIINQIVQTVNPDDAESATQTILAGASQVRVGAVVNGVDDFITLPLASDFKIGHQIVIACLAGTNFEMRTLATSGDTINNVDCSDGATEYLCTDTDTIIVTVTGSTSFIAQSLTNLGAVRTAVIPD